MRTKLEMYALPLYGSLETIYNRYRGTTPMDRLVQLLLALLILVALRIIEI